MQSEPYTFSRCCYCKRNIDLWHPWQYQNTQDGAQICIWCVKMIDGDYKSMELLKHLREDISFQAIMSEMLKKRPVIPEYTPQDTIDLTANLMEKIKYSSAQRAGFDLLYRALVGRPPE